MGATLPRKVCPRCGASYRRAEGRCSCSTDTSPATSNANNFYQTHEWRSLSARHLRENPVCVLCDRLGVVRAERGRAGLRTDHVIPIILRPDLRLEPTNLQTLCLACDMSVKRRLERGESDGQRLADRWDWILDAAARGMDRDLLVASLPQRVGGV